MSGSVLAPGVVIAETYEVERQLGQGGMGEVWLAKHRRLAGKQVAIKVLRTTGQLPADTLARFRREAEIAARLEHPNIVQVLDFNTLPSGEPFLVMEYLKGNSLAHRLRGGPLSLEQVGAVVRQVGAALQAAHAAGVVHRDLKPENIFLVPTGVGDQVKVLDFGISKLADSQTVQTTDSVLIGTPLYMSPEQALGNNRDVSPRSDVFSLGSIVYEMLTGQPPFLADNVAKVVFRIAYEKHPPLKDARPELPDAVVQAVEHALAKDREQRTKDMATFVHELTGRPLTAPRWGDDEVSGVATPNMPVSESLAGGATISRDSNERATPAPRVRATGGEGPPTPGPVRPRPALLAAALGAGLLLGLGGIGYFLLRAKPLPRPQAPDPIVAADAGATPAALADAGGVAPVVASPLLDAGPALEMDAGLAQRVPDAGRPLGVKATRGDVAGEPSAAEQAMLDELERRFTAKEYQSVLLNRRKVEDPALSGPAKLRGLKLLVRAACKQKNDNVLPPFLSQLRPLASRATLAELKQECVAEWPDSAPKWE